MTAKEQLIRLVRIQELALAVAEARKTIEDAPVRIEEIEARFRERNEEYVALKARFEELESDTRMRNGELEGLQVSLEKYMKDLMGVQNQREYAAMLKEIDTVKQQIGDHEDTVLTNMEESEKLKEELADFTEHIAKEREEVARERAEVEAAMAEAEKTIERCTRERAGLQADLPKRIVMTVERLEGSRQGVFLSKTDDGTCLACYVRVRPQVFQEIKNASKVHACGNCRRLLYHAPSIEDAAALATGATAEAVNGESV